MKKILAFVILSMILSFSCHSQILSSTYSVLNSPQLVPGSINNPVLKIKIEIGANSIILDSIRITSNGCTNSAGDLSQGKLFYTDTNNLFAPVNQYGSTVFSLAGIYMVYHSTLNLAQGTHYFWLTYNVLFNATPCNCVSGSSDSLYYNSGLRFGPTTDGNGCIPIAVCATGIDKADNSTTHFIKTPNPVKDVLTISASKSDYFSIVNTHGEKILTRKLNAGINKVKLRDLKPGIYYLVHGTIWEKIVKL